MSNSPCHSDDEFEDAEEIILDPITPTKYNRKPKNLYTILECPEASFLTTSNGSDSLTAKNDVDELRYQIRNLDTGDMIDMRETNSANFVDKMAALTR